MKNCLKKSVTRDLLVTETDHLYIRRERRNSIKRKNRRILKEKL